MAFKQMEKYCIGVTTFCFHTKKQSSKDSTSPMSETCKIQAGQVKFQDRKPDWACKIVESKLKKYSLDCLSYPLYLATLCLMWPYKIPPNTISYIKCLY